MERLEEENGHLWEAVGGTYSNGGRVKAKFTRNATPSTTCWLLEKINYMDEKMLRMERTNSEMK